MYITLLFYSTCFNYMTSELILNLRNMADNRGAKSLFNNKIILILALMFNISLLCFFKYVDFFISSVNNTFDGNVDLLNITLPLGISFFTITQIACLADYYNGLVKDRSIINYTLFVIFTSLIAGPILHHRETMP